jgi:hypothetical protein
VLLEVSTTNTNRQHQSHLDTATAVICLQQTKHMLSPTPVLSPICPTQFYAATPSRTALLSTILYQQCCQTATPIFTPETKKNGADLFTFRMMHLPYGTTAKCARRTAMHTLYTKVDQALYTHGIRILALLVQLLYALSRPCRVRQGVQTTATARHAQAHTHAAADTDLSRALQCQQTQNLHTGDPRDVTSSSLTSPLPLHQPPGQNWSICEAYMSLVL